MALERHADCNTWRHDDDNEAAKSGGTEGAQRTNRKSAGGDARCGCDRPMPMLWFWPSAELQPYRVVAVRTVRRRGV